MEIVNLQRNDALEQKMEIKLPFPDLMRVDWCFMCVAQQQIALSAAKFLMVVA